MESITNRTSPVGDILGRKNKQDFGQQSVRNLCIMNCPRCIRALWMCTKVLPEDGSLASLSVVEETGERVFSFTYVVCFTYSSNFGELMDFIIESQICDSFPTGNLCHWHHSVQCEACHLFHNACKPKRLCVNQIFILADSSNLGFFTHTVEGAIKIHFKLARKELFYLKSHVMNLFFSIVVRLVH